MMLHSAEVRWFLLGSVPIQTVYWFDPTSSLSPEERTDRYLVFPGCESVGVKVRQGNFEIKALRGAAETTWFPGSVSGRTDCWVKWSYNGPAAEAWIETLAGESEGWVDVAKVRWQRRFALEAGHPVETTTDTWPDEGCNVELTRVLARSQEWWSLAFEAFGEPGRVREILRRVGVYFFVSQPPLDSFLVVNSCSYPTWLAGLARPQASP